MKAKLKQLRMMCLRLDQRKMPTNFLFKMDYVQIKYNNEVLEAILALMKAEFMNPEMPKGTVEHKDGKEVMKPNEMNVFI